VDDEEERRLIVLDFDDGSRSGAGADRVLGDAFPSSCASISPASVGMPA
jgi:hypothetical protein